MINIHNARVILGCLWYNTDFEWSIKKNRRERFFKISFSRIAPRLQFTFLIKDSFRHKSRLPIPSTLRNVDVLIFPLVDLIAPRYFNGPAKIVANTNVSESSNPQLHQTSIPDCQDSLREHAQQLRFRPGLHYAGLQLRLCVYLVVT